MRGKVRVGVPVVPIPRITPAYAGKSDAFLYQLLRMGDHPRVCGEKTKKIP